MKNKLFALAVLLTGCSTVRPPAAPVCLNPVDHFATHPIPLKGRLAVTFVDQKISEKKGDQHEIGVFDLAKKKFLRLSHNLVNEAEVEISPDGKKFLYTVRPKLDAFDDKSEIWQIDMDGKNRKRLVHGQPVGVPAWHYPEGDKLTYIKWGGESDDSSLFTFDLRTRKVKPHPGKLLNLADPEFSYDGKQITFKMSVDGDRDNQPSIYIANADGSRLVRLTRGFSDHDPVFSHDGKKIYFERYYGPGDWFEASQDRGVPAHNLWGIVEVDAATKEEKIIIPHDPCGRHFYWLPTVSPDGKYLMYVHIDVWGEKENKPWTDLWVSRIDGSHPQKVRGSDWFYFFDWAE